MINTLKKRSEKKDSFALELLENLYQDYSVNRYTFVDGDRMKVILKFLGATDEDLVLLEDLDDDLGTDPTLPFRKSRNGRFLIDLERKAISRLEFQPFVLSKEEEFVRADSGMLRYFRGIQDNAQNNTAFQALIKFQACMIKGVRIKERPYLQDGFDKWVSTIFQLRTLTTTELIGEPAQEGVHSDGVEHTMTTFLKSENMTSDSAISQIHTQNQELGIPWGSIKEEHVVGEVQHRNFLDTLLIVDSELRHSVSDVKCIDVNQEAIRDMIIFFTRRPKDKTHSSFKVDSLNSHVEIPLEFPIV